MLSSEEIHEVFSFYFSSAVSAQSFLGDLECSLGVLQAACFEVLDDSLLVTCNTGDLRDDLPDELSSLAEFSFS